MEGKLGKFLDSAGGILRGEKGKVYRSPIAHLFEPESQSSCMVIMNVECIRTCPLYDVEAMSKLDIRPGFTGAASALSRCGKRPTIDQVTEAAVRLQLETVSALME